MYKYKMKTNRDNWLWNNCYCGWVNLDNFNRIEIFECDEESQIVDVRAYASDGSFYCLFKDAGPNAREKADKWLKEFMSQ